jgi:hypothetical protein
MDSEGRVTVAGNFYPTLAQVFPLLLLAVVWDSRFLERLRRERRLPRKVDPAEGVRFWYKPRVRVYTLLVVGAAVVSMGVTVFVLAGVIPDSYALRLTLSCVLALVLLTLLTRISVDVLWATQEVPDAAPQDAPGAAVAAAPVPRPAEPGRPETVAADGRGEAG